MTITILSRLDEHAARRGDEPACYRRRDGVWQAISWRQLRDQVRRAARSLIGIGVGGGTVGILGGNRPEWTVGALAAMACGGAPVGIYTTSSPEQVSYIVRHAGCSALVVEDLDQWRKVEAVRGELETVEQVVLLAGTPPEGSRVVSWEAFLARGEAVAEAVIDRRLAALAPDQLATLIYTSGTTGTPKGVMLSHSNLVEMVAMGVEVFRPDAGFSSLSYLPLAHIAEQMFSIHIPVSVGYPVYYAESLDRLADDLREVQPVLFFGVPRVWERMYEAIIGKMAEAPSARRRLFEWTLAVGRRAAAARNRGLRPGPWLALQERLADRLVSAKVRARLGLARARVCATGAAPIAAEILELFAGLGLTVYEVYGQTETCGAMTFNRPGRTRFGTVGPPLPRLELRLAPDSEILVRGPNVFMGYYRDPAATAEALDGGWLRSGDLGSLDGEGFLTITGRKKEILITSGGKNIAPAGIEAALKRCELIAEAVVVGERRRYLTALLTLDPEAVRRLGDGPGAGAGGPQVAPAVLERLEAAMDETNRRLARVEQIRKFRVLPAALTIEAGELTPTMKVRRQVVYERYAPLIDEMYADAEPARRHAL
jgi:long-chain acyl-CoA synthetase